MSQPYIGEIRSFGYTFAPRGWLACDGQLLPIAEFEALFSIIGTTYGGDGITTFGLPDLRGRGAVGWGQGPGLPQVFLGESFGVEEVFLTTSTMPAHTHAVGATSAAGTQQSPGGGVPAASPLAQYAGGAPQGTLDPAFVGSGGGGQPHENRDPYVGLIYCIAVEGVFPPQS